MLFDSPSLYVCVHALAHGRQLIELHIIGKEISAAQSFMQSLVDAVNDQDLCNDFRIGIVAFRDHPPEVHYCHVYCSSLFHLSLC